MSLTVKICGLSAPDALQASLDGGADMVGFVSFARSPRHVADASARELGRIVEGRARKVLLTVDADDAALERSIAALEPDLLQLHGTETPERIAAIKQRFGLPVMKAIGVGAASDLNSLSEFAAVADRVLFDARPPKEATRPGGLGQAFDWALLDSVAMQPNYMLSGGLSAANVGDALRRTRAHGVDVSSGVETAPGVKDPALIREFIRAAREVELLEAVPRR